MATCGVLGSVMAQLGNPALRYEIEAHSRDIYWSARSSQQPDSMCLRERVPEVNPGKTCFGIIRACPEGCDSRIDGYPDVPGTCLHDERIR